MVRGNDCAMEFGIRFPSGTRPNRSRTEFRRVCRSVYSKYFVGLVDCKARARHYMLQVPRQPCLSISALYCVVAALQCGPRPQHADHKHCKIEASSCAEGIARLILADRG